MPPKYPGESSFQVYTPTTPHEGHRPPQTPVNGAPPGSSNVFALPGSYAQQYNLAGRRPSHPGPGQSVFDSGTSGAPRTSRINTPSASGWSTPVLPLHPFSAPASGYATPFERPESAGDLSWDAGNNTLYDSRCTGRRQVGFDVSAWNPSWPDPSDTAETLAAIRILQQLSKAKLTALGLLALVMKGEGSLASYRNTLFASNREEKLESFLTDLLNDDKGGPITKKWMLSHAVDLVCDEVHREMDAAKPELRMYANEVTPRFLETWDLRTTMQNVRTPVWDRVLDAASETKASKRKAKEREEAAEKAAKLGKPLPKPAKIRRNRPMGRLIITAQVIYLRSSASQKVQIGLGLMAWSTGASKQLLDVLHLACLTMPYTTIRHLIDAISLGCVRVAASIALGPHSLSYDNINLSTSIFVEQGPRTPSKVQSGTFAVIYELYGAMRSDMLLAPMHANLLSSTPLTIADLRPPKESLEKYLHQARITVARILFKYVDGFQHLSSHPQFDYVVRRLVPHRNHRTVFHPLRVSTIEEASVEGNLLVHDDVYVTQLGRDATTMSGLAIPLFADQLTLARVRGAQEIRKEDVDLWEQRFVFQLAPGVFHLIMNLIWALLHVHRGTLSQAGSLTHFFTIMEKTRLGSDNPDFHTLLSALNQILDGLVLYAWQLEVDEEELGNFAATNPTPDDILRIAGDILRKYSTPRSTLKPTDAKRPPTDFAGTEALLPPDTDIIMNNTFLLVRDLLYVTELVKAVQTGDWGRIEDVLPLIACMFRGAGSNNYSNEILHLLFNLSRVWTPKFADIMRNNILVNVAGLEEHWQAIDMNIEHQIRYLKTLFASKGIYSNWERLGNISASVNCLMNIKKRVAESLEAGYQGKKHQDVDTSALVWRVASKAREYALFTTDPERHNNALAKPSTDVITVGYSKFESASLATFNKKMTEFKNGIVGAFEQEEDETTGCTISYVSSEEQEEQQDEANACEQVALGSGQQDDDNDGDD
ncbi:hypothetical protein NMY22_g2257 [Coprinellus aureogranulatus]|nr:hypothetical protein NMY22_g2257 [Coprinellus aureogranulatus]